MKHIFLFLILFTSLFAELTLKSDVKTYDKFSLKYLYDLNNTLDIKSIQKSKFNETISNKYTLGYHSKTIWFKLLLKNESDTEKFTLYYKKLYTDEFKIYEDRGKGYQEYRFGLETFKNKTGLQVSDPIFNFKIKPHESKTLYIKTVSRLGNAGTFQIFSDVKTLHQKREIELFLYMFYFGGLLMALLINGFLFLSLKEKVYGYYAGYIVLFGIFISVFSGFIIDFGFYSLYDQLHALISLAVSFLILFSCALLDIKKHLPKTYKFLLSLNLLFFLLFILIWIDVEPWYQVMSTMSTVAFLTLLYAAVKISLLGFKKAKYYLILMIIYVISLGIMTGIFNGTVPNTDINMYAFLYVSFIEMSFFSLILANRINESSLQTIIIKDELLEQKNINARELEEMVRDRTKELEILQEQLKIQANRDPLTELYNRRYFSNIAKKSFNIANRYEQKLSILMLDLDYFKRVNDSYGHGTGDDVIVAISQKLRKLSRNSDIVARYGGEEFIVLLPRTSLEDARILAQRICDEIREIRVAISDDKSIKTTVSIGVCELSVKDENIECLISRADCKLYEAKANGRNRVIV